MAEGWRGSRTARATVTNSETAVALDTVPDADKRTGRKVRIQVEDGVTIFYKFSTSGSDTITIPTDGTFRACQPVPPNFVEIIRAPANATHITLKAASGSTLVYISQGEGD